MIKGIYCLVLSCESCTVRVGSLGDLRFFGGYYVYVGSALGPGGLSRVTRHIRLSRCACSRPRWHIDYLLCSPLFSLETVYCFPTGKRAECLLASLLCGIPVPRFGCSDCSCHSHLFFYPNHPAAHIEKAAVELSLSAHSKTIKNQ